MLSFFRTYQRYFFMLITVVIVISFSFFGTYSTLQAPNPGASIAFTAVDGTYVTRQELDEMVLFLSTDNDDKLLFGGIWGPNFLNDGVINKDILQTGLAELLAKQYAPLLEEDYASRHAREKAYTLYVHPQARFISTVSAWSNYAPQMNGYYQTITRADDPLATDPFNARVQLYLAEKRFPSPLLKRVLHYQEKQQTWVTPDENLDRQDLSLFGYHIVEDWFGPRFVKIAAQYIINSAIVAKQQGYEVSQSEAAADLVRNAEFSFQQNKSSAHLAVKNSQEYFNEQLRRMGFDQTKAIKLWQKVLLFRRLFHDAGSSMFVDPNTFTAFVDYAKEPFGGEIYQLPKDLQLADYRALQKFELYLSAVAERSKNETASLALPQKFLSAEAVAKKTPELVQKRYRLLLTELDVKPLATKVSLPEMWNWEVSDAGWAMLKTEFPELGVKKGDSRDERFAAFDTLNDKTRNQVDSLARKHVAKLHPEWIDAELSSASAEEIIIDIPLQGTFQLKGINDPKALRLLLDQVPLAADEKPSVAATAAQQKLAKYSDDERYYYKISVLERMPSDEVVTYAEANRSGTLDRLLDSTLEAYYPEVRSKHTELFQQADKSWKPFKDVKDLVADFYFADILQAINTYVAMNSSSSKSEKLSGTMAAPKRLLPYMNDVKNKLAKSTSDESAYVVSEDSKDIATPTLAAKEALDQQWKLQKSSFHIDRSSPQPQVDRLEIMTLPMEGWSLVHDSSNGAMYFYQKLDSKGFGDRQLVIDKSNQAYRLLGNAMQRTYGQELLTEFKAKDAISLAYMNTGAEMTTEE